MKIGLKNGNAAFMVGAGILLWSVPVVMVVFMTSLVYQGLAHQYFDARTKKDKVWVSLELSSMLIYLELQLKTAFSMINDLLQ